MEENSAMDIEDAVELINSLHLKLIIDEVTEMNKKKCYQRNI